MIPTSGDLVRVAADDMLTCTIGDGSPAMCLAWIHRANYAEAIVKETEKVIADRGVFERDCTAPLPERIDFLIVDGRTREHLAAEIELAKNILRDANPLTLNPDGTVGDESLPLVEVAKQAAAKIEWLRSLLPDLVEM